MIQLTEQKDFSKRFVLTENNYSFQRHFIPSTIQQQFGKKVPTILKPGKRS
jgi:hypothetical protein